MGNILKTFAALAVLACPALADAPRTIIVMDGSGSMWGQIDGRPKLEIARDAVATVLSGVPAEQELGLMAYGHREKGNCSDIELIVPPAPGTGAEISAEVGKMRFLGKTPLSEAVRQAAQALRFGEEAATVVLITDGLETCDADPCALGRELEAAGLDFTAHVIGFDLSEEDGAKVSCLAENTGGLFLLANDGASLGAALTQTVEAPPPAPTVPGVMLFSEPDFAGESFFLGADTPDFTMVFRADGNDLNDWAASARVVGSWQICEHVYYQGTCQTIEGDLPDLGGLSQSVSSLRRPLAASETAGAMFDTDLFGSDISSFTFDAAGHDWPECAAACAALTECQAWTYVHPGRTEFGECFLKDAVPDRGADPCCISGYKDASAANSSDDAPDQASAAPALVPVRVTLAPPAEFAGLPINWSAEPLDPHPDAPEALAMPEAVTGPWEAELYPGRWRIYGEATPDQSFGANVTVTDAAGQSFEIPPTPFETMGMGEDAPSASAPVQIRIKGEFGSIFTRWQATPIGGQASEVLATDYQPQGWQTALDPGRWLIEGFAKGGKGHLYAAVIEVAGGGPSEVTLRRTASMSKAPVLLPTGEPAAASCAGEVACYHTDPAGALRYVLLPDWAASAALHYETAGGATANAPSVKFYAGAPLQVMAALNPRQWDAMLGPCADTALGPLCSTIEADPAAVALLTASLAAAAAAPETAPPSAPIARQPRLETDGTAMQIDSPIDLPKGLDPIDLFAPQLKSKE